MAVVGSAYIVINAITTGFKNDIDGLINDVDKSFKRMGRSNGNTFSSMFSRGATEGMSNFQQEALKTKQNVDKLVEKSYYLQGALGVLIPVVGAVAAGITVMGLEVAAAGPSFIVLGGVIASFIQGMVAFKLALGGVGKAVGAINKPGGGVDRMPQLLQAVTNASDRLLDAELRLVRAQRSVTDAYKETARALKQLEYNSEDAVNNEARAAIELEKARETLLRVQDLPPNSRARREAELAYKEADLNLRRAKTGVEELNEDLNAATKNGEWNTEQQIENSRAVLDAIENRISAERDLKKAVDAKLIADNELAKGGKGGAAGADPFEGLNKFQIEFAKFIAGLKPQIDKLKLAVSEGLLPALQQAITIVNTKLFKTIEEKLKGTGIALGKASKDFANAITTPAAIANLRTVMDTNNYVLSNTGIILGNLTRLIEALLAAADPLIRRFTDWIKELTGGWASSAEGNISGLTDMFNHAGDIAAGFGDIIGNIIGAFMNMGRAVTGSDGAGQTMLDWLVGASQRFEDFTAKHLASGKLQEYFHTAWRGFQGILGILKDIIEAILRAGGDESLDGMVKNIGEGVGKLIDKMPEIIEAGVAFAEFIGKFLAMVATFLESGSVQMFFGVVGTAISLLVKFLSLPGVSQMLLLAATMHGLRLGIGRVAKGFETVGKYVAGDYFQFQRLKSASNAAFHTVKTVAANAATAVRKGLSSIASASRKAFDAVASASRKAFAQVQKGLSSIASASRKAFDAVASASKKAFDVVKTGATAAATQMKAFGSAIKNSTVVTKLAGAATKVWTGIQAAFNAVMAMNPIALIVIGVIALIAAIILAYKRFESFRNFVNAVFGGLRDIVMTVVNAIIGAFKWLYNVLIGNSIIPDIIDGIIFFFQKAYDFIKVIVDFIVAVFRVAFNVISAVVEFAWNNIIKPIFEAYGAVFSLVWAGIKLYFETVWKIITTGIAIGWAAIKLIFEAFKTVFGLAWDGIKLYFETVWAIITTGVKFAWNNIIKPIFEAYKTVFVGAWDGIKSAFKAVWDYIIGAVAAARSIFGGVGSAIKDAFKAAFNFVADAWNGTLGKIGFTAPKWLGGWSFKIPTIPRLAEGGIVMPSTGGTLARIGEAGRPERVEPLDPDGLSKRDKAMIKMMTGGAAGGVTINVHPSPGMNEVELASLVSRQLAFQLRAGSV